MNKQDRKKALSKMLIKTAFYDETVSQALSDAQNIEDPDDFAHAVFMSLLQNLDVKE